MAALSCKSSKSKFTDSQIKTLETLVEKRNFTIESDWAYPQVSTAMQQVLNSGILQPGNAAGAISLIGNSNFLTITGDSITSYLPYFGERQMSVDYGGRDSAIQLKGLIENYTEEKGKNNVSILKFDANSKSENFRVSIRLFPNLKSEIIILGATRFPISYAGRIEAIN